jgi:outer membrane protein OmpA-like peptidoglycan-associated protein
MLLALTAAAEDWPRYETSLQYTFTRFNPTTSVLPTFNANGGSGQFAYNFNRSFSAVLDLGAVYTGNIHSVRLDTTLVNFLAGPRVSIRKNSRITPYFQTLFGGVYGTTSTRFLPTATPLPATLTLPGGTTIRIEHGQTAFAMTAGGGLDLKLNRHVSFRPIQAEYFLTRLNNFASNDQNQNNFRYSAGFTFTFGGEEPTPIAPPPQTKTCPDGSTVPIDAVCPKRNLTLNLSASQREVCPGETVQVNASIAGGESNHLSFVWSVDGQAVSQGHSLAFGTAGRQPGTYTIGLTVNGANFNPAAAKTAITVREYIPPTATAQANPAEIYVGEKSTLTATCHGQCGGTMQPPTFSASDGSVQGDQFDSTGVQVDGSKDTEQRKTVTITATCADARSTGTATTDVTVVQKASIAAIRLPDVLFDANSARVNNCGKRILLEQVRAYSERDSTGKVVLVGHSSSDEKPADLAEKRALNAAAVITAGTGACLAIPQSQVLVSWPGVEQNGVSFEPNFCSASVRKSANAEMRRVEVWFVPTGGQPPSSLTASQEASALSVSSIGCPK